MALYLSPLVAVKEIDLTTTIPAVATSIAVTALRNTYKGPELKKQFVSTVDELIELFGEPNNVSYKDILTASGYLKYGNKLYCTRVMPEDALFSGIFGPATAGGTWTEYTSGTAYKLGDFESDDPDDFPDDISFGTAPETSADLSIIANSRGAWGDNIKIAVIGKDEYNDIKAIAGSSNTSNLTDELYEDVLNTDFSLEFNGDFIVIVKVRGQRADADDYDVKESFLVSTDEFRIDDEGQNLFCENLINNQSNYIRIAIREATKNTDVNAMYTADYADMGGGSNGGSILDADIINAFELYEDPEEIDVNIFIDSDKSDTIKQELVSICEERKDCMSIVDCRYQDVVNNRGSETTDLRDYRLNILNENTSYGALYGNWLNVYDKWNAKYRWIPASGHVAGIFANTDDVSDPWFAPAGLNRAIMTNIRKLAWNPNQGKRDILYKNGINPIVSFAGQGKVLWGQKNLLDKSSAFNRINVRRLFIVLEKAISTASKYFLFEPNDQFTRTLLVNMITPFLRDVRGRRGIYDFLVVCDDRNNTPERIDRNELWCDIYIKPTRAAEFIVLQFIATKTGASFTELATAIAP